MIEIYLQLALIQFFLFYNTTLDVIVNVSTPRDLRIKPKKTQIMYIIEKKYYNRSLAWCRTYH